MGKVNVGVTVLKDLEDVISVNVVEGDEGDEEGRFRSIELTDLEGSAAEIA